jgi:D-alanine-D-alanine ligase-like ATP-grasp enzyme
MDGTVIGLPQPTDPARLDPHARELLSVAAARGHRHWMLWPYGGGPCLLRVAIGDVVFGYSGGMLRRMDPGAPNGRGRHINGRAFNIAHSKQATRAFLLEHGFAAPQGRSFAPDEVVAALAFAETLAGPVCVKPEFGQTGIGVAPDLIGPDAIRTAFARAGAGFGGEAVVVERSLAGAVIRFFYVAPRVVGVKLSRPASVVGDGFTPIGDLILAKNQERDRRGRIGHRHILADADVVAYLARTSRDLATVPSPGERVFLRAVSNAATGADTIACPGAVHPGHIAEVEAICAALAPLKIAALDTIIADPAAPPRSGAFAVLEINNSPDVLSYLYPWEGPRQDVVGPIVDLMQRIAEGAAP